MNVNNKISVFHSCQDAKPALELPGIDFCASVMAGEYKNEVLAIRDMTDKVDRDRIKKTLPAVTISGTFSHRANDCIIQHSGFICVDLDGKQNPQVKSWTDTREMIGKVKQVLFCALSVSGCGCFAIIPIAWPDKHKQHFEALRRDFMTAWGITIDSLPDVSRLRIISYDPGATWQPDAVDYDRLYVPPPPAPQPHRTTTTGTTFDRIRDWLEGTQGIHFTTGSRNIFIAHYAAACHRLGILQSETERELLRYASQEFTETEIRKTIQSIYRNQNWVK